MIPFVSLWGVITSLISVLLVTAPWIYVFLSKQAVADNEIKTIKEVIIKDLDRRVTLGETSQQNTVQSIASIDKNVAVLITKFDQFTQNSISHQNNP